MRKPNRTPDSRLNWRDPAMPVMRDYRISNGTTKHIIDPEYERQWREMCMEINTMPTWRNDPTYNMRKDRRK